MAEFNVPSVRHEFVNKDEAYRAFKEARDDFDKPWPKFTILYATTDPLTDDLTVFLDLIKEEKKDAK